MKLLLVEDSMARAMALADSLEPEGIEVTIAHTASDASRRLAKIRPDALLLCASLAGRTPTDLLRIARADAPHLRVILIKARPGDQEKFAEFSPDAVFESFTPQQIVAALRRLLAA